MIAKSDTDLITIGEVTVSDKVVGKTVSPDTFVFDVSSVEDRDEWVSRVLLFSGRRQDHDWIELLEDNLDTSRLSSVKKIKIEYEKESIYLILKGFDTKSSTSPGRIQIILI